MTATIKKIYYFCTVKNIMRHEVAAIKSSVFCVNVIRIIKRIEWVNGNVPEAFALCGLTTRNTLILFNVKNIMK